MIILDTHIWIWWVHGDTTNLSPEMFAFITQWETQAIGICAISCWEVAKLVERGRLQLPFPIADWLKAALSYTGVQLLPLSPQVAVESTQLPGIFHRDPADQLIVATARVYDCPLVTIDQSICAYPHVKLAP